MHYAGLDLHKKTVQIAVVDKHGNKLLNKNISSSVTRGRAHDSPVFREMFERVPDGTGCVMLDAEYDAVKNYKMI